MMTSVIREYIKIKAGNFAGRQDISENLRKLLAFGLKQKMYDALAYEANPTKDTVNKIFDSLIN